MAEQIMEELKLLIYGNFEMSQNVLNEKEALSLLSPQIGLMPRDLLVLMTLIEEKYNIRVDENEIVNARLDYLKNLVHVLEQRLKQ
jgi:acyl carrier protein